MHSVKKKSDYIENSILYRIKSTRILTDLGASCQLTLVHCSYLKNRQGSSFIGIFSQLLVTLHKIHTYNLEPFLLQCDKRLAVFSPNFWK